MKGVAGQDDFAMLHEVITRRLKRGSPRGPCPTCSSSTAARGSSGAALAAARDLGVATRPDPGNPGLPYVQMVGLAKSRTLDAAALCATRVISRRSARSAGLAEAAERAGKGFVAEAARTPERIFLPGRKDPVVLRQNSAELYLLVRLRDEAHRFAIEFHRSCGGPGRCARASTRLPASGSCAGRRCSATSDPCAGSATRASRRLPGSRGWGRRRRAPSMSSSTAGGREVD